QQIANLRYGGSEARSCSWPPSIREDFGHSLRNIFESFETARAVLFGDGPAIVSDVVEGFHDGGPIVIAFAERHVEAFPQSLTVALLEAELLDMKFLDAFAEDAYPVLRPAEVEDVADIKMPPDRRA